MATKPFTATIKGENITIIQDAHTGLFHAVLDDGRHTPVSYMLIKAQTTSQQRLKYWRNRFGYTQEELAKRIHVSGKTIIMMWESGRRHPGRKYRRLLNAELGGEIFPD